MDESLVVLATMILDIPLGDILQLDSKHLGGCDDGGFKYRCFFIQQANFTAKMQTYLSSPEWQIYIKLEVLVL
jgi:hypothetical protein